MHGTPRWRRHLPTTSVLSAVALSITTFSAHPAAGATTEADRAIVQLISAAADGTKGDASADEVAISADGRYVAFESSAANLHPDDTDTTLDVYVKDMTTGTISLVSTSTDGVKGNHHSQRPSISADGRYVAFDSRAKNLHRVTTVSPQVFVKDLVTGELRLASASSNGVAAAGSSLRPSISADGRYVAFDSAASNLHPSDADVTRDVYVKDLSTGSLMLASTRPSGVKSNGTSKGPSLSVDGTTVAFESSAANLHPFDIDATLDIYVKNLSTGSVALASMNRDRVKGNFASTNPSLSADGRRVAFQSSADNLDPLDGATTSDVYVKDVATGELVLVSTPAAGSKENLPSREPVFSRDGQWVAYSTDAGGIHGAPPNSGTQVVLEHLMTGAVRVASVNEHDELGNGSSLRPAISADGAIVAFSSFASNLTEADTDASLDAYVARFEPIAPPTPPPGDGTPGGEPGEGEQADAPLVPLAPARLLDTRPGATTTDGSFTGTGRTTPNGITRLQVAGRGGIPTDATAAILNLTIVNPVGAGFATAYPCTPTPPVASNINFAPGDVVANAVLAKLSPTGEVCILTSTTTDLVVDANGYVPSGGAVATLQPARLLDTRPHATTADGRHAGAGELTAMREVRVQVAGRGGVPADASAAIVNLTAVLPEGPGFMLLYPCSATPPTASNLNFAAGDVIANAVIVQLTTSGEVCLLSSTAAHALIDVNGYSAGRGGIGTLAPARLLDTRPGATTTDGSFTGTGRTTPNGITRLQVAGRGGIPTDATAAILNLTIVNPVGAGFATAYPCTPTPPVASNINFARGDVVANAVLAKLSPTGEVCILTSTTTDLVVDANGYVPRAVTS